MGSGLWAFGIGQGSTGFGKGQRGLGSGKGQQGLGRGQCELVLGKGKGYWATETGIWKAKQQVEEEMGVAKATGKRKKAKEWKKQLKNEVKMPVA